MMDVFQDYARFYNALYKEKDYSKEAKEADSIIKKWDKMIANYQEISG